jgi:hypothetical protein
MKIKTTKEPQQIVKALMGSLIQNANAEIHKNSKELYKIGESALSPLIEAVVPHDWSKIENKNQMRLLTGIVSLINDINEEACQNTAKTIIERGCTRAVKQCLNSITAFTLNDYTLYNKYGINIYILKELKNIDFIEYKLDEWLSIVPKEDIIEIDRVYVIPDNEDYNYNGTYTPILSYINLVWKSNYENSFFWKWMDLVRTKHTLYHEIGHHYHRHSLGQNKEQEKEADDYARVLMKKAHPNMAKIGKTLKYLGLRKKRVD